MHMLRIIAFAQEMIVVGVKLHLKLLIRPHERVYILIGVLHMYIVICRTVNDEYVTGKVSDLVQQRGLSIPAVVHLWTPHVALRIGAVV